MATLFKGTLREDGGCVIANAQGVTTKVLVLWPPEYRLVSRLDGVHLIDAEGKDVAILGQPTEFGGGMAQRGETSVDFLNAELALPIPSTCKFDRVFVGSS